MALRVPVKLNLPRAESADSENVQQIGRFAPSPTGDLHLGNLQTALLAWLHARLLGGHFFVRMEDVDQTRVVKGSDTRILRDLEILGLDWDGSVVYQSARTSLYLEALAELEKAGLLYPCFCSRKQLAEKNPKSVGVYPGICRDLSVQEQQQKRQKKSPAIRVRVGDYEVSFNDVLLGHSISQLDQHCGDFIMQRADGFIAYQLAVVVDDIAQSITHVVRGADLYSCTPQQCYLFDLFAAVRPGFLHTPLMQDEQGKKMSKRDGSCSLSQWQSEGHSVERLIGDIAFRLGFIDTQEALTASELLQHCDAQSFVNKLSESQRSKP